MVRQLLIDSTRMVAKHIVLKLLFVSVFVVGISDCTSAQTSSAGIGKNAIGTLLIVRADGIEDRLRGEGSMQIFEGDILKTEPNGQALIILRDGTQVALNENTTMKILTRWEKAKGNTPIIRLSEGEVWLKIDRAPKPIEV